MLRLTRERTPQSMRGPWYEVGQDVAQRLGTGHDQRAFPHDAQVPDDLPQVFVPLADQARTALASLTAQLGAEPA